MLTKKSHQKHETKIDCHDLMIDGHHMKFRTIDFVRYKDGVELPHMIKQIYSNPPAPVKLI